AIAVVTGATDLRPVDLGSYASRVTLMTGNAAIRAAERARDVIALHAGKKLEAPLERVTFAEGRVFDVQDPERGLTFAEAVQLAEAAEGTIGTVGSYTPAPSAGKYRGAGVGPSPAYSYSACVAEVDVDPATGIVRVPRIWIAHDLGAKECGQGPLLPVPPAVANAVYDAVGVRIDEVPITPEKVFKALRRKEKGEAGRFGPARFPDIPWPEPTRVATPWEGGDGRAAEGGKGGKGRHRAAKAARR